MKSYIIPIIIALVLVSGLFFWFRSQSNKSNSFNSENDVVSRVWSKGNPNSKVVLTEYSDFQCPACSVWYSAIESIVSDYQDKIKFEYRHYPLSYHKNAFPAAVAAEAAGNQNKFWEMYSLLFINQKDWEKASNFESFAEKYAGLLELDINRFKQDLKNKDLEAKIREDQRQGNNLSLPGTPSFLINNEFVEIQSEEELRKLLNEAVDSKARERDNS